MSDTNNWIVDLTKLGFEISVHTAADNSTKDHSSICDEDTLQEGEEDPAGENLAKQEWLSDSTENLKYTIVAADNVSCMSYDTYEDEDDSADDDDSYVPPRRNMPTKTFPRRTDYRCKEPVRQLSNADLDYEPALPSAADLGYGGDEAVPRSINKLRYDNDSTVESLSSKPSSSSLMSLLSVGRPVMNRRSMGMGQCHRSMGMGQCRRSMGMGQRRRFTNDAKMPAWPSRRQSNCSRSTVSSGKKRQAHSRSRNGVSLRERIVTRSASRRLSRQHSAQIPATQCCAAQQTLQDLGCAEVFFDPSRRMPRRVSLEYGNDGADSVASRHQPKSISLEFVNSTDPTNKGGSRVPRQVSIQYEQQAPSQEYDRTISGQVRRGSLGYSTGTSCLPRRGSLGGSSVRQHSSVSERTINRHNSARAPPRPTSDNSLSITRISRRTSIANIPRQQMRNAAFGTAAPNKQTLSFMNRAGHRRLSLNVASFQGSRTPGAMVGSAA